MHEVRECVGFMGRVRLVSSCKPPKWVMSTPEGVSVCICMYVFVCV